MNSEIGLDTRLRVREDVVFRDLEGEAVILHLKTGVYFGLDPVATRIWHFLYERRPLRQILDALLAGYDVAEAQCEQDLLRLAAAMQANCLVDVEGAPAA